MTFTYDLAGDGFTPRNRVRFALADKYAEAPMFQDEELDLLISDAGGSWKKAVIAALRHLVAELSSTPSFTADWLKVEPKAQLDAFRKLLADKEAEYADEIDEEAGGGLFSGAVYVRRIDAEEPPVRYPYDSQ